MRNKSLRFKINGAIFATCFVVAVIFGAVLYPFELRRHESHVAKIALLLDTIYNQKYEDIANEIFANQKGALSLTLRDITRVDGIAGVSVYLPDGEAFFSTDSALARRIHSGDKEIFPVGAGLETRTVGGRSLGIYAREIEVIGQKIGTIEIYYDLGALIKERRLSVSIFLTLLLTTLLLMSILLNFMLSRFVVRPVSLLREAIIKIQKGHLGETVDLPFRDEIGIMGEAFNAMSLELYAGQEALKQAEEKFRGIFENASVGIYRSTADEAGTLLTVNPAFAQIMGYASVEDVMQSVVDIRSQLYVDADDRDRLRRQLRQSGMVTGFETRLRRKDGTLIDVSMNVRLVKNENGETAFFEGIVEDITEKKQASQFRIAKEAAEAAARAKSQFLANMSHEIRTPMNAIIGLTYLALKTDLTAKQRDYLRKIEASSKSLLHIINDILDFSKIEAGRLEMEKVNFDLTETLKELATVVDVKTRDKKSLNALFVVDPRLPVHLIGDPTRLRQVLINLCDNAIKFTEKGEVTLTVSEVRRSESSVTLRFSVEDTGIGMHQTQIDRLFQSFTQADSSTTRKFGGTGLGLVICKVLVEKMNGDIWVESQVGQGSRFTFTAAFDLFSAHQATGAMPQDRLAALNVMVISGDSTYREQLGKHLRPLHFRWWDLLTPAQSLEKLTDPVTAASYDLMLLDWRSPGTDEHRALSQAKRHADLNQIPVVLMVDMPPAGGVVRFAGEVGLESLLVKPFDRKALLVAITETLHRSGPSAASADARKDPAGKRFSALEGARVLLVEDNEINRQLTRELLAGAGMIVTTAGNGLEALEALEHREVDAVLMDVQMPVMDGYEATAEIRRQKRFKDLPIIALTSHAMSGDREKSVEVGMNDHIAKPIDPDQLFATLLSQITPTGRPITAGYPGPKDAVEMAVAVDDLVEMPGIDVKSGLVRAGGREAFYGDLLAKFHRDFSDSGGRMEAFIAAGESESALRLLHTVKGVSANLGATELSRAAADLETVLRRKEVEAIDGRLTVFQSALAVVLDTISVRLKAKLQDTRTATPRPLADAEKLRRFLLQLEPCLLDREARACKEIMKQINAFSWPSEHAQDVEALSLLIDRYKFKEGQIVFSRIVSRLERK